MESARVHCGDVLGQRDADLCGGGDEGGVRNVASVHQRHWDFTTCTPSSGICDRAGKTLTPPSGDHATGTPTYHTHRRTQATHELARTRTHTQSRTQSHRHPHAPACTNTGHGAGPLSPPVATTDLHALEQGQQVIVGPADTARAGPAVVVFWVTSDEEHGVDGRTAAQDLAPGKEHDAAAQFRLWGRLELPVQPRALQVVVRALHSKVKPKKRRSHSRPDRVPKKRGDVYAYASRHRVSPVDNSYYSSLVPGM